MNDEMLREIGDERCTERAAEIDGGADQTSTHLV